MAKKTSNKYTGRRKIKMTDWVSKIMSMKPVIKSEILFRAGDIVDVSEYERFYLARVFNNHRGFYENCIIALDKAVVLSKWDYKWYLFKNFLRKSFDKRKYKWMKK